MHTGDQSTYLSDRSINNQKTATKFTFLNTSQIRPPNKLLCTKVHYTTLHSNALFCNIMHSTVQHFTLCHCSAMQCTSLNCTALNFICIYVVEPKIVICIWYLLGFKARLRLRFYFMSLKTCASFQNILFIETS